MIWDRLRRRLFGLSTREIEERNIRLTREHDDKRIAEYRRRFLDWRLECVRREVLNRQEEEWFHLAFPPRPSLPSLNDESRLMELKEEG